jgi:multicomponent Na+:H+ antiporter subunit G
MTAMLESLSILLMCLGAAFMTLGSIGIIKMPDFFRRLHAVSMSDTLGIILFTAGMLVHYGLGLMSFKLLVIFLLMCITNPVGSHALARAAYLSGMKPWRLGRSSQTKERP